MAVLLTSIAAVAAFQLAGASVAAADSCDNNIDGSYAFRAIDSAGFGWDFTSQGDVYDGLDADAYDDYGLLTVDGTAYDASGLTTCVVDPDGRQFDLPEVDMSGLKVSRKAFVPATGTPFGRIVSFLSNPTGAPITVQLAFTGNLGSDTSTKILATSSGDQAFADPADDVWAVTADHATDPTAPSDDPPLAHVWDSAGPGVATTPTTSTATPSGTTPWADAQDIVRVLYDNVTVQPGATIAYMQIEGQRHSIADA